MTHLDSIPARGSSSPLSDADFQRISKIAKSGWGLNLDASKKPLIKSRLSNRVTELGLSGFDAYCKVIEAGDAKEVSHFVSALTTNVTHFYREVHHFEHLEQNVLPEIISNAKRGNRVRIWSAGCSTGQEPYSLAGSILKIDRSAGDYDLKILATDIDPLVLKTAEAGRYKLADCRFPSSDYQGRIFSGSTKELGDCSVRSELKSLITFRNLNLVQDWPLTGQFDIIMCRNVAIYFDRETQSRLWGRFANAMVEDGYLYIGHSERVIDPGSIGLNVNGTTTYRKSS